MCAAQSNAPASFGTYTATWGYADNSRESVVEISPNINYTVSESVRKLLRNYLFLLTKKKEINLCPAWFFRSNSHKLVKATFQFFFLVLFFFF